MSARFEQICITAIQLANALNDFKVHSYEDLAAEAEVSKTTVGRYIKAMRNRGYPIKTIFNGKKRGLCIDPRFIKNGRVTVLNFAYDQNIED
jgi:biotin operon repressor